MLMTVSIINRNKLQYLLIFLMTLNWNWSVVDSFFTNYLFHNMIVFKENEYCQYPTNGTQYAIIIHGWKETCETDWTQELGEKLTVHRGGCIICMDYRFFAYWPHYFLLAAQTHRLSQVLLTKLQDLERKGFSPDQGYMFGFSLGGRIALEAGRMYGTQKIAEIDICDMAGPGFDKYPQPDPKVSAKNVQCIHTSKDKGTKQRDCHQNWLMGICGVHQQGATIPPFGSHGLCPLFYNSAFENDFYAETNPKQCRVGRIKRFWPNHFKMGYTEDRKIGLTGTFYASTTEQYPYTDNDASYNTEYYDYNSIPSTTKNFIFWYDGAHFYI